MTYVTRIGYNSFLINPAIYFVDQFKIILKMSGGSGFKRFIKSISQNNVFHILHIPPKNKIRTNILSLSFLPTFIRKIR